MKTVVSATLLLFVALASPAVAQTKTPVKSTTKPAAKAPVAKPATKAPAAKPAVRPATPAAKPTPKPTSAPAAAPATTAPAATTAASEPLIPAQGAVSFKKSTTAVNLGVGLGLGYGYSLGFGGNWSSTPALSVSLEKGIINNVGPGVISVGGLVGFRRDHYEWDGYGANYEANWTNIIVAARGAYHYNFTTNPKLDTYAGLSLGVRIESYSNNYDDQNLIKDSYGGGYVTSGIFLGGRYFFTDKIGAFAEAGYDMSFLKLGLSAKF